MTYRSEVVQVCEELAETGGYEDIDAASVAAGLSAMTSGLWLDLLTNPRSMSRERAIQISMSYLATTFYKHYS
jgi:hypothetical protein